MGTNMVALEKLNKKTAAGMHICVGLDTDIKKIPQHLLALPDPIFEFNKIIIENTASFACAYKMNFAFYEKNGVKGIETLHKTRELIPADILTIADAKRGDIGNTSEMYAQSVFDQFHFDSVTLHPYMGFDSLSPFLNYKDKLNFILALTSNPGSVDFEKQKLTNGKFLYQLVIEKVNEWNTNSNCGIVFGATNSDELKANLTSFKSLPILLPGVGTQGGSLEEVVHTFNDNNNNNYLINLSRALIYTDNTTDFGNKVNQSIKRLDSEIRFIN
jgi:orotidine-5'-phosphate decarboxylase